MGRLFVEKRELFRRVAPRRALHGKLSFPLKTS